MYKILKNITSNIKNHIAKAMEEPPKERDPLEFLISRYKTEFLPFIKQKKYEIAAGELLNEIAFFEVKVQENLLEYRRRGGGITGNNVLSLYLDMTGLREALLKKDEEDIKNFLQDIDNRHTILENFLDLQLHLGTNSQTK